MMGKTPVALTIFLVSILINVLCGIEYNQNRYELRDHELIPIIINPCSKIQTHSSENSDWTEAYCESNPERKFFLGNRIILAFADVEKSLIFHKKYPAGTFLETPTGKVKMLGELYGNFFLLKASDSISAIKAAAFFARLDGVTISYPVVKSPLQRHWSYAPIPHDKYYYQQWNLENRASSGLRSGVDINARSAWAITEGAGVVVAVSDGGIDLEHPELVHSSAHTLHYNFELLQTNGMPASIYETHGTHVAGLITARKDNRIGMAGVSPRSRLASWVIFGSSGYPVSNERLAQMFTYGSNSVHVQVHPWGFSGIYLEAPTTIEQVAISNAIKYGRNGKGIVMVRSAGNDRGNGGNTTYNGYSNDPFSITVAAVRSDGRVSSYSNPGSSILVCAPGGDPSSGSPGIFTTDINGTGGVSGGNTDLADYLYGDIAFSGSSAAAPHIGGIAALVLSVNTNLTYRDVQQILLLSAKIYDEKDPFLKTNGAGLRVSFNTGYGIPDAGYTVRLAAMWSNRPPLQTFTVSNTTTVSIPESGFRLLISGINVPSDLTNIVALPNGFGARFDEPSRVATLVYVPDPLQPISSNLAGRAVLFPRIGNFFDEAVLNAAAAGAIFAVFINNNSGSPDERVVVNVSDYSPIPSACISWRDGSALRNLLTNNSEITAQLKPTRAVLFFNITRQILCEHVGLFIKTDHQKRGQLRIALKSPMGTISILQRTNYDHTPNLSGWTYYTTHFFYEQAAGIWQAFVSDEMNGTTGSVVAASLTIYGTLINDTNLNALDDSWEARFNIVGTRAADDPDRDGLPNSVEQILDLNPVVAEPTTLDMSRYNDRLVRLSWNGSPHFKYFIHSKISMAHRWEEYSTVYGSFPETEMFIPITNAVIRFFKIGDASLLGN